MKVERGKGKLSKRKREKRERERDVMDDFEFDMVRHMRQSDRSKREMWQCEPQSGVIVY